MRRFVVSNRGNDEISIKMEDILYTIAFEDGVFSYYVVNVL